MWPGDSPTYNVEFVAAMVETGAKRRGQGAQFQKLRITMGTPNHC